MEAEGEKKKVTMGMKSSEGGKGGGYNASQPSSVLTLDVDFHRVVRMHSSSKHFQIHFDPSKTFIIPRKIQSCCNIEFNLIFKEILPRFLNYLMILSVPVF